MARLLDETFEMFVMAQYNIARHGGVETIGEHNFCNDNVVLLGGRDCSPGRELGISPVTAAHAQGQPRRLAPAAGLLHAICI